MITVTDNAVKQLRTLLAARDDADQAGLRLAIDRGGCSGLQYHMSFSPAGAGDEVVEQDGVRVFVEAASASHLRGSVIDYLDGLTGTGFRIENPNARRTCGCGTSFEPNTAEPAPAGEFLTAEQLYNRYNSLSGPKLRETNRQLERSYLRNYSAANEVVPYVKGRFTIMDSYELGPTDFVPSGAVALAVSTDFPRVLIEHIYSSSPQDGPLIRRNLQTGMDVELRKTYELTAVLHVARLTDGHLQLTVVPINYGRYIFTGTSGGFELQPPPMLNVAAGWPLVRGDRLESANQAYLDFRTRSGQGPLVARKPVGQKPPLTALKGVDAPLEPPASTPAVAAAPSPPPPVAKAGEPAVVKTTADPEKPPVAAATPAVLLAQADVPVPRALPVNESARRGAPTPATVLKATAPNQTLGGGVSLQPFLGPAPAGGVPVAAATKVTRTWPTYAPGRAPPGRNIRVAEVGSLSQRGGFGSEPVYLTGQFVVSAVGENKEKGTRSAVMRSSSGGSKVRVLVDYPRDRPLPTEGAEVSRDEQRPYQIMDVRQLGDGTLNVYVREITE